MKKFTKHEILELYGQVTLGEISFSQMVEIMNERVSEAEKPNFKEGDFLHSDWDDENITIIFKNQEGDKIYYHASKSCYFGTVLNNNRYWRDGSNFRYATEAEKKELLDALAKEGKRWNAEKLCIENIPVRKFKIGDKVRIRHGVSSETHRYVSPNFTEPMDEFIGKELTVKEYSSSGFVVFFGDYLEYYFHENWLEPYEGLKKGDLAIFWDNGGKHRASVRMYGGLFMCDYYDTGGVRWDNAIKFESKEQYERLIKGGDMNSGFMYFQSEIDGGERCETQCDHCKSYYAPLEDNYRYFPSHDIARCNRDDCHLHLECARWLDRLPMEEYWYSQFEPKGCEDFIEKKKIESKKKKR